MRIRNPSKAGEILGTPAGGSIVLDARGEATVPDDCGLFNADGTSAVGEGWVLLEGTPTARITLGNVQQAPGEMVSIQAPAHMAGQTVSAPDGSKVHFNAQAIAVAPSNCGLLDESLRQMFRPVEMTGDEREKAKHRQEAAERRTDARKDRADERASGDWQPEGDDLPGEDPPDPDADPANDLLCPQCGQACKSEAGLRSHVRHRHPALKVPEPALPVESAPQAPAVPEPTWRAEPAAVPEPTWRGAPDALPAPRGPVSSLSDPFAAKPGSHTAAIEAALAAQGE